MRYIRFPSYTEKNFSRKKVGFLDFSSYYIEKLKDMTRASQFYKRSYTNGYEQKVNFYLEKLDQSVQNEDANAILYYKKKFDYFLGKQVEYINKKQHDLFAERIGIDPK